MDISELLECIEKGEDSQTQLKESFKSIDALAAEIAALSNSNGGSIIVGVSDDGVIKGLSRDEIQKLNEWISNTCSQKIDPPVNVSTQIIKLHGKNILIVDVPMGPNKFYMANGKDIWVKVGADKRRAKREEIQRLLQSSRHLFADEMPVEGTDIKDMNMHLFKSFYQRRTHEELDQSIIPIKDLLTNLKLFVNDELTLAGLLAFGWKPEEKRPQFSIKAVLFPGTSPSATNYKDSRDIIGNIPIMFDGARSFLVNYLRWLQEDQDFNTVGILEIPQIALEEALINAIVHRNYFISSNIRIFIFSDRVEIISPGCLPNTISVESIKVGVHIERNPILVSMLKDIEAIPYRGIGTGILRIIQECKKAGIKVDFVEEKQNEQFRVIFHRKEIY